MLTETRAFNTPLVQAKAACFAAAMKRLLANPEITDEEAARIEREAPLRAIGR
ncbi:MAG: hypothetical protein ACHQQS_07435 [Thermoanaerobaculales bacterium]